VPAADGVVQTARREAAAVGTEGGRMDVLVVAPEAGDPLMRLRIQEDHGVLVLRPDDGQPAAVRAVSQGPACGREQPLAGPQVADAELRLRTIRPRGHPPAVGTDGERAE